MNYLINIVYYKIHRATPIHLRQNFNCLLILYV